MRGQAEKILINLPTYVRVAVIFRQKRPKFQKFFRARHRCLVKHLFNAPHFFFSHPSQFLLVKYDKPGYIDTYDRLNRCRQTGRKRRRARRRKALPGDKLRATLYPSQQEELKPNAKLSFFCFAQAL